MNADSPGSGKTHGETLPDDATIRSLLEKGRVLREQMVYSHNSVYVVELGDDSENRCLAIYKPRDGEAPLWDFPSETLYRREYLSYAVSEALGWGIVPTTLIRDGPYGIGTIQRFINAEQGRHYFNLLGSHRAEMTRIAIFDCVVNNTDRKGGHCLVDGTGRIWAIDHGLTFSSDRKLRTVMWDLAEEAIPDDLREAVRALKGNAQLREALQEHLTNAEIDAFYRRVEVVTTAERLPLRLLADPYKPAPSPSI